MVTYSLLIPPPGPVPQVWLSANDRLHYMHRARLTKAWRTTAAVAARSRHIPRLQRAAITARVHFADTRRRDIANYHPTVKAVIDGIVDACVLPDDNDNHVIGPDLRRGYGAIACVQLLISPVDITEPDSAPCGLCDAWCPPDAVVCQRCEQVWLDTDHERREAA